MKHLMPTEAAQFLHDKPNSLFVDCRSSVEFLFVGHPLRAVNIPWNDGPDWEINPHFVGEVKKLAGHGVERPVVIICRSGSRSIDAGRALEAAGFKEIFNVLHGFEGDLDDDRHRRTENGWLFDGLPWEQT